MSVALSIYEKIVFLRLVMRRVFHYLVILILLLPSCKGTSGNSVRVVKPRYHHWFFDRKKDKKAKRTKIVRMKG